MDMKCFCKLKTLLILVVLLFLSPILLPSIALASDISHALWYGNISITNNSTSPVSSVSANFSANTTYMIDAGFLNSSANNCAIKDSGGNDVAFMPGYGSNPWIVQVGNLSSRQTITDTLYTGNATSGSLAYFPSSSGMSISDNSDMELGSSGNFVYHGFVNTALNGAALKKTGAIYIAAESGQIQAGIGSPNLVQPIMAGNLDPLNPGGTEYNSLMGGTVWNGTENLVWQVIPTAGTLSNLRVDTSAAVAASSTYTFTIMKNGNPETEAVTIAGGVSDGSDVIHSVSFVAGDTVSIRSTYTGAPGVPFAMWYTSWTPTTPGESICLFNAATSNAAVNYFGLQGGTAGVATEGGFPIPTAGTFSKLYLVLSADPGTSPDDYKFMLRKASGDTTLTTTITADNTTGSDLTHTVTAAAGDLFNWKITPENAPSASPHAAIGVVFTSATAGESLVLGGSGIPATGAVNYANLCASPAAFNAIEADVYSLTPATKLERFYVSLSNTPGEGKSWVFNIRQSTGNSGITVTISGATDKTGNDITNTSSLLVDAYALDVKSTPSGTPTGAVARWGVVAQCTVASVTTTGTIPAESTITVREVANHPQWATGNTLSFAGTGYAKNATAGWRSADSAGSIVLWYKTSAAVTQTLFSTSDEATNGTYIFCIYLSNTGQPHIYQKNNDTADNVYTNVASTEDNNWHQLIITSDSSSYGMFVDGVSYTPVVSTGSNSGDWFADTPNRDNIAFGAQVNSAIASYYTGKESFARVYSSALSAPQCATLYTLNSTYVTNMVNEWYFDTGSGTSVYDYGGSGNTLTLTNGTWGIGTYTAGATGQLCDFTLQVDSSRWGVNLKGVTVPNTQNNWQVGSDIGSYVYNFTETVGSTLECSIAWQYAATFTDASGNHHDATPSFRTTASDANVTAVLNMFAPINQAKASVAMVAGNPPWNAAPTKPPGFTAPAGTISIPIIGPILFSIVADVHTRMFILYFFSFLMIWAGGIAAIRFGKSIVIKAFVMGALILGGALSNVYGIWTLVEFGCYAFGILIMSRHYGFG